MKKQKYSKEVDFFIVCILGEILEEETKKRIFEYEYEQTIKQSYDEVPLTIYG